MIKDIHIPDKVKLGIRPLKERFKEAEIWGADFETVDGEPYTIQISTGPNPTHDWFKYLERPTDGLWSFLDCLEQHATPGTPVRCYWWYTSYDFPCLMFQRLDLFKRPDFKIGFKYGGEKGSIWLSCHRSWFGNLTWGKYKVQLLDAFQFFRMSLDKASQMLLKAPKVLKPKGLGSVKLKTKAFERYSKVDARLTRRIGLIIEESHVKWDIRATVSASQFASKVFRKQFLHKKIPYIPKGVETAGVLSYHGGLNWVTPEAPKLYRGVYEYDISSAYPEAFNQLPDIADSKGKWIRFKGHAPRAKHGFIRIQFTRQCDYYGIRGHRFESCDSSSETYPQGIWVTLYEFRSSRKCLGACRIVDGYYWNKNGTSPFTEFMGHFYKAKTQAKNAAEKYFAKICLNGLSGKLVQNRETIDGPFLAGGLWNPAMASLVTGYTRARMHTLLHKHNGLHCATDSIFTKDADAASGAGIGALEKGPYGDLLLLRNKLYVFFRSGTEEILKWGAHGFWGKTKDLLRLWNEKGTKYKANHIYKVREAFVQNKKPLRMVEDITRTLGICWNKYTEEHDNGQS